VAQSALAHCLECYTEVIPVPPEKGPNGKEPVPPPRNPISVPPAAAKPLNGPATTVAAATQPVTPAEYYKRVQMMSREEIITDSQRVLSKLAPLSAPIQESQDTAPNSVFEIVQYAFGSSGSSSSNTTVSETDTIISQSPVSSPAVVTKTETVVSPSTPMKRMPVAEKAPAAPVVVSSNAAPVAARPMPSVPAAVSQAQPAQKVTQQPAGTRDSGMNMSMADVVQTLRQSPYPEYRDWAADNLATVDGVAHPDVVQALVSGARSDQSPTVRASCVRALGKMRCSSMVVMSTMQAAKTDPDSRVRHEADVALQLLTGVDPAGLKVPSGH
jgi:hypothetical protein